jgi:hypothetical protein
MNSSEAVAWLVAQRGIPLPMQEVITVVVVLTGGGLVTLVLSQLPSVEWLSSWAAVGTLALTFLMGYADGAIGDVMGRVLASDCVGWDAYSRPVSRLGERYEVVLPRTHPAAITAEDASSLAEEVRGMASELRRLMPPAAAEPVHTNLLAVLVETERQLQHAAVGHPVDRITLNALLDQQRPLTATANRVCR